MTAVLSSASPSTAVYFDARPLSIALIAAFLMLSGVSKSGSPAPSPMTSRPAALSARALSVTAMVAEGLMRDSESLSRAIRISKPQEKPHAKPQAAEFPNGPGRARQDAIG